ncbi:MAG: glycoside hydrolase family 3 protein [Oscillospiraceae bacterium]
MKQILPLILSLLLLLSCAACGEAESEGEPDPPAGEEETVPPEPQLSPEEETAAALLSSMTLEEKVGQLFFVRCPEINAAEDVAAYHLGGLLLFGRDFKDKTREEIVSDIESYQAAAALPLFIGVDEEGGTVCRVSSNPALRESRFLSPRKLYAAGGLAAVTADAAEKDELLRSLGINVNFAPVVDITTDPADFMYDRSLGEDAETTAAFAEAVVEQMRADGVASVLKHFPGYGNNVDTHTGIAVDERSLESFRESDFLPFAAGIQAGTPFVLVSHNIMTAVDGELPASLSPAVHELLRQELGFAGVILTDDLAMDAVEAYAEDGSVAALAVLAGNDMIVTTDYQSQIPLVIQAVEAGQIPESTVDAAVTRILLAKLALGLISTQ